MLWSPPEEPRVDGAGEKYPRGSCWAHRQPGKHHLPKPLPYPTSTPPGSCGSWEGQDLRWAGSRETVGFAVPQAPSERVGPVHQVPSYCQGSPLFLIKALSPNFRPQSRGQGGQSPGA